MTKPGFELLDLRNDVAVIICLAWKDVRQGQLCWQCACEDCGCWLGVDEVQHAYHEQNPMLHPYMCLVCAVRFMDVFRAAGEWSADELRELWERQQARRWVQ